MQTLAEFDSLINQPARTANTDAIEARITNIRWKSPDSTRCIVQAVPTKGGKPFSIVGDIDNPAVHQVYEFEGKFQFNAKYNTEELRLSSYRTVLPDSTHGIQTYLVNTAKWVGAPVAKALTDAFGKDTLNVIKTDPQRVAAAVPGVTLARATEMQASLIENAATEAATIELHQIIGGALPKSVAAKAIKAWGGKAAATVRRNPFKLTALPGVGFAGADTIWRSLKKPANHPRRHCAAILHVMAEMHQQSGDTCLDQRLIVMAATSIAGQFDSVPIFAALKAVSAIVERTPGTWALADIAAAEVAVARRFVLDTPRNEKPVHVDTDGLAPDQIAAAKAFEASPVFILTGAPGTGKTYTTARLIQAVRDRGGLALCAPTGKAAKQMSNALSETCGGTARTIHSLLGPDFDEETKEFSFVHGPKNPLDANVLIVDETSMLDIRLANQLLSAVRDGTRILFVGDTYQLPSVGPGCFLRDLIAAGVPSFELTAIKRNAGNIVRACHAIKDGKHPSPSPAIDLDAGENWRHLEMSSPDHITETISSLYRDKLPEFGFRDIPWDVQTISPVNTRGPLACAPLNALIQGILNPGRTVEQYLDFSVGDKVVRLKNGVVEGERIRDDDAEDDDDCTTKPGKITVVNGDAGTVIAIDKAAVTVKLTNPDRIARLPRRSHELRLAYCMTCHKMQGSEAPVIVLPLSTQFRSMPLWNREWIYTAMSRAKTMLITVGPMDVIHAAVRRVGNTRRKTLLAELLRRGA